MHEALFSDAGLAAGFSTLDIAKGLIDEGFHPMTVYFPLVVHGAMLIEPTETESRMGLDRFIASMRSLAERARAGDERLKTAPHFTRAAASMKRWPRASRCWCGRATLPERHNVDSNGSARVSHLAFLSSSGIPCGRVIILTQSQGFLVYAKRQSLQSVDSHCGDRGGSGAAQPSDRAERPFRPALSLILPVIALAGITAMLITRPPAPLGWAALGQGWCWACRWAGSGRNSPISAAIPPRARCLFVNPQRRCCC
jgi:hypothetical protein